MVTTEALLRLTDQLRAEDPDSRLEPLLVPFDPTMRVTRRDVRTRKQADEAPLTQQHAASHDLDLTHRTRRERDLRNCVAEDCAHLVSRCQDGITDPHRAWQVGEWIGEQLDRDDLTRVTRGRLITALAVAAGSTDDGAHIRATFDWVEARLPGWGPCTPADQCDRCTDDAGRTCRYLAVRYALVAAFLYQDDELSVGRAGSSCPTTCPGPDGAEAGRLPDGSAPSSGPETSTRPGTARSSSHRPGHRPEHRATNAASSRTPGTPAAATRSWPTGTPTSSSPTGHLTPPDPTWPTRSRSASRPWPGATGPKTTWSTVSNSASTASGPGVPGGRSQGPVVRSEQDARS